MKENNKPEYCNKCGIKFSENEKIYHKKWGKTVSRFGDGTNNKKKRISVSELTLSLCKNCK